MCGGEIAEKGIVMRQMQAEEIIRLLGLRKHPMEGGYFVETYRTEETIGDRSLSTAIYFLLTNETFSEMHRLNKDEIFHFYYGDPVEMLQLYPDGSGEIVTIGNNLAEGELPQAVVPRDVWQGSRLCPGGSLALMGTTMAPGFDYQDYESGDRARLIASYPNFRELIFSLTRDGEKGMRR